MSMFVCARCDSIRDSDDGCEEVAGHLVCAACADEIADDEEEQARSEAEPVPYPATQTKGEG